MRDFDHRPFAIPLFVLGAALTGAGLVTLLADAVLDFGPHHAAGAIGAGLLAIFGSLAVTILLHPESDLGRGSARAVPVAGALVVVLLVATVGASATFAATAQDAPGLATSGTRAPSAGVGSGPLTTQDFSGELQGAATGTTLDSLGATTKRTHALDASGEARNVRAELTWTSDSPSGAAELELRFESNAGEILASTRGASPLVLDLLDAPADGLRLAVSLAPGSASAGDSYEVHVSFFVGEIPRDGPAR